VLEIETVCKAAKELENEEGGGEGRGDEGKIGTCGRLA